MAKQTGAEITKYVYDFDRLLVETDGSDNVELQYTSTLEEYGDTLSETSASDTLYHQYDAPGSTSELISDDDSSVERYAYRAFGLVTDKPAGEPTKLTYIGRQQYHWDIEAELYLLGAGNSSGGGRHYDPASGRFVSQDPAGPDTDPLSNLYRYVGNNPVNATDPSGRGVGHHFFPWEIARDLYKQGRITLEALELAMGYTSGHTTPWHRNRSYPIGVDRSLQVTTPEYNSAVLDLFEGYNDELALEGPMGQDEMHRFIQDIEQGVSPVNGEPLTGEIPRFNDGVTATIELDNPAPPRDAEDMRRVGRQEISGREKKRRNITPLLESDRERRSILGSAASETNIDGARARSTPPSRQPRVNTGGAIADAADEARRIRRATVSEARRRVDDLIDTKLSRARSRPKWRTRLYSAIGIGAGAGIALLTSIETAVAKPGFSNALKKLDEDDFEGFEIWFFGGVPLANRSVPSPHGNVNSFMEDLAYGSEDGWQAAFLVMRWWDSANMDAWLENGKQRQRDERLAMTEARQAERESQRQTRIASLEGEGFAIQDAIATQQLRIQNIQTQLQLSQQEHERAAQRIRDLQETTSADLATIPHGDAVLEVIVNQYRIFVANFVAMVNKIKFDRERTSLGVYPHVMVYAILSRLFDIGKKFPFPDLFPNKDHYDTYIRHIHRDVYSLREGVTEQHVDDVIQQAEHIQRTFEDDLMRYEMALAELVQNQLRARVDITTRWARELPIAYFELLKAGEASIRFGRELSGAESSLEVFQGDLADVTRELRRLNASQH